MKKIFILFGLFLVFQGSVFAAEQAMSTLKMSDVQVFVEKKCFGLKDKNDNVVVKPIYKKLIKLGTSSWIVQKNNRFGLIDSSGNVLVSPKYRHVDRFFGKYVKLGNDNDFGLYDETGKIIVPPEYSSVDPLFGQMFLVCKNFKYGIIDSEGKKLLNSDFDDIYMPSPTVLRIQHEGQWYEIERLSSSDIVLPEGVKKVTINNKDFKVTTLMTNTGLLSGYSALTLTDYTLKVFSSISPAYEQTIDDLMFSQGADTVTIFAKMSWIPMFPFTYAKKYFNNFRDPNSGPLAEQRNGIKRKIK